MDNEELLEYIRLFREKANANKLIVFVGAGVSCNIERMPTWSQLISKMAEAINYSKCESCKHNTDECEENCKLKNDFSQDEFLKIPQYVYNKNKNLYKNIISENIVNNNTDKIITDAPLSNAIFNLNPAHIITTNYDKLLESCSDVRRENYKVIIRDKDLLVSDKNKYIIKMHGDVAETDTIVLKESDYLEYSQTHVLIEMFVKALLADHIILFLGYSLNDYNIKLIISWINFIRSKSKDLNSTTKIGFIALDSDNISHNEIDYFENNNIGVINLKNMPLIYNIPDELTNEIGKRLYSFLNTISDPSCERHLGLPLVYDDAIDFLKNYRFVDCERICDILHLGFHTIDKQTLVLRIDASYDALIEYMNSDSEKGSALSQLFVDAGITTISLISTGTHRRRCEYTLDITRISLLYNQLYQLYVNNKYQELLLACEKTSANDWREPCFYITLIKGYANFVFERYNNIQQEQLTVEEKVAYLFNNAILKHQKTHNYKSQAIQDYINGIPGLRKRQGFKPYLNIFEGNTLKLLVAKKSLVKLKEQYKENWSFSGCSSLGELYKVKKIAMEQYQFYYSNNLFYKGFSDLQSILKVYAEAIICTNVECETFKESIWGSPSPKEKYPIGIIDFDILTKMVAIKKLYEYFKQYHVETLNVDNGVVDNCVECFVNIAHSIIELKMYNRFSNVSSTLINSALCLSYIELTESQKTQVSNAINLLLQNKDFVEYFFSIDFPEWAKSPAILLQLMDHVSIAPSWEALITFLNNPNLQKYMNNAISCTLREFVLFFIGKNNLAQKQKEIKELVQPFLEKAQIKMIGLMTEVVTDKKVIAKIKKVLSDHFDELDTDDIVDFSFNKWLELSQEKIDKILDDALKIKQLQTPGTRFYPDPLERQLELICLLHITDIIKDISVLQPLTDESDFLKFFLDDSQLNYTKIDFSHYMWENIVHTPKYTEKFKAHKEEIIPHIEKRIKIDVATEFERKFLYGVLLDKVF